MNYYAKKVITLIITLLLVSVLAFIAFQVISDPATAILGTEATEESLEALRHELGLDRPLLVQYGEWLLNFIKGDFGTSYSYRLPVAGMILSKLPLTGAIVLISFLLMLIFSFPIGIISARYENSLLDQIICVLGQVFMSVPAFLSGVIITYLFGILFKVFTPGLIVGFSKDPLAWLLSVFFPALAIAIPRIAMCSKMLRSSIINQMKKNYVVTSYSRGRGIGDTLSHHVLRNAVLPVITFFASSMAEIVANSILVEQVFALPGIGVLLLSSIGNRDFPVVLAITVLLAAWVVIVNFIADVLCQLADPRVRMH